MDSRWELAVLFGCHSHPCINPCMGKKQNHVDSDGFFGSSNIIGVSYQPGFRGGITERIISLSPEIAKPNDMSVSDRGDVAGWNTALGFNVQDDPHSGWYFWEIEQRMERSDPEWSFIDNKQAIMREIAALHGYDGRPIVESSVGGNKLSFISHWDVNRLRQIWPNALYVIPHWFDGYRWFRDVYSKVHSKDLHTAELDDMMAIAKLHDLDVSGIRTIIEYHAWKWSGFTSFDAATVKKFMRREIGRIRAKQGLNRIQRDVHTLDLARMFGAQWRDEYTRLCSYCGITPIYDLCESLILDYNSRQWMR